jgi:hypothetical protein
MDRIEVTAHFDSKGGLTPLNFTWNNRTYRIEGTGRRWEAKDELHILVMAAGNQVFHIVFDCKTFLWNLVRDEHPAAHKL